MQPSITSTTTRPGVTLSNARRVVAARLASGAAIAAVFFLAALHILSPELDPAWRMVSEYALGSFGWVLSLMFLAWSLSSAALFLALREPVRASDRARSGQVGLGLLLVSALGAGMAAFFDVTHSLHGLAALLGIPTFPIAALLISSSLARSSSPPRPALLGLAHLTWISLALFLAVVLIGLSQHGGFGPGVLLGWPNRLIVVADCAWTVLAARSLSARR